MARHSKNNQTKPFFTYEERRKHLPWGNKGARVGGDSLLEFGVCSLCLKPWEEPLTCQKGHTYCKECIYSNLLHQKGEIAKAMKAYDEKQAALDNEETRKRQDVEQADLEDFEQREFGVLSGRKKARTETAKTTGAVVQAARGYTAITGENPTESLKCFWIPSLTPAAEAKVEAPNKNAMCPEGTHPLRLKQLTPLKLKEIPDVAASDPHRINAQRYQCPACHKSLVKNAKASVLKKCGHVLCQGCIDRLVGKDNQCFLCSKPVKEGEVIALHTGGTGFSLKEAKIHGPSAIL